MQLRWGSIWLLLIRVPLWQRNFPLLRQFALFIELQSANRQPAALRGSFCSGWRAEGTKPLGGPKGLDVGRAEGQREYLVWEWWEARDPKLNLWLAYLHQREETTAASHTTERDGTAKLSIRLEQVLHDNCRIEFQLSLEAPFFIEMLIEWERNSREDNAAFSLKQILVIQAEQRTLKEAKERVESARTHARTHRCEAESTADTDPKTRRETTQYDYSLINLRYLESFLLYEMGSCQVGCRYHESHVLSAHMVQHWGPSGYVFSPPLY